MEGAGAGWPEPVVRVQSLSESGAATIPESYVKPEAERPAAAAAGGATAAEGIPVVDLSSPGDPATARAVSEACREWGFFQAVNHGVPPELLRRARGVWRGFFRQPMEVKQRYANSPATYEGYGSRLGVEKGAVLDWGDYYFLHVRPPHLFDPDKWPHLPPDLRYVHTYIRILICIYTNTYAYTYKHIYTERVSAAVTHVADLPFSISLYIIIKYI